jgi:hypothetical protein
LKTAESKIAPSAAPIQRKSESPFFDHASEQGEPFFTPSLGIQTKLTVGQPNDKYEQEADNVADKVVQRLAKPAPAAMDSPPLEGLGEETKEELGEDLPEIQKMTTFASDGDDIQRKCAACEAEEQIQKKDSGENSPPSEGLGEALSSSKGGGSPLPDTTRSSMESAMGTDFSTVRIHTGNNAVQMSQDLNAHAFTHGSDVYFNEGKYDTASSGGQHLLTHELTHTVQQGVSIPFAEKSKIEYQELTSEKNIKDSTGSKEQKLLVKDSEEKSSTDKKEGLKEDVDKNKIDNKVSKEDKKIAPENKIDSKEVKAEETVINKTNVDSEKPEVLDKGLIVTPVEGKHKERELLANHESIDKTAEDALDQWKKNVTKANEGLPKFNLEPNTSLPIKNVGEKATSRHVGGGGKGQVQNMKKELPEAPAVPEPPLFETNADTGIQGALDVIKNNSNKLLPDVTLPSLQKSPLESLPKLGDSVALVQEEQKQAP